MTLPSSGLNSFPLQDDRSFNITHPSRITELNTSYLFFGKPKTQFARFHSSRILKYENQRNIARELKKSTRNCLAREVPVCVPPSALGGENPTQTETTRKVREAAAVALNFYPRGTRTHSGVGRGGGPGQRRTASGARARGRV